MRAAFATVVLLFCLVAPGHTMAAAPSCGGEEHGAASHGPCGDEARSESPSTVPHDCCGAATPTLPVPVSTVQPGSSHPDVVPPLQVVRLASPAPPRATISYPVDALEPVQARSVSRARRSLSVLNCVWRT